MGHAHNTKRYAPITAVVQGGGGLFLPLPIVGQTVSESKLPRGVNKSDPRLAMKGEPPAGRRLKSGGSRKRERDRERKKSGLVCRANNSFSIHMKRVVFYRNYYTPQTPPTQHKTTKLAQPTLENTLPNSSRMERGRGGGPQQKIKPARLILRRPCVSPSAGTSASSHCCASTLSRPMSRQKASCVSAASAAVAGSPPQKSDTEGVVSIQGLDSDT